MLYIGTNHLGNFSDTPLKIINLIKSVDCVIVEFEEQFLLQLKELKLQTPQYIIFEQSVEFYKRVIEMVKSGKNVLLLNEMGCAGVADPGSDLIDEAIKEQIPIETVAGPSISPLAVASSGYSCQGFISIETFNKTDEEIDQKLIELQNLNYAIVILEKKERVLDVVKMSDKIFKDRGLCLCINIGWPGHQKIIKSSITGIIEILENNTIESVYGMTNSPSLVTMVFGPFSDKNIA